MDSRVKSPMDMETETLQSGLKRRADNRKIMMDWIKKELIDGTDYGKIHVVSKTKCSKGRNCDNSYHFSKPVLFKSGAEKILVYLGGVATFPQLEKYEEAIYSGAEIKQILLRCIVVDNEGNVIGTGVGGRTLEQDYGDFNKMLKMGKKSAFVDAVLSTGGLSEAYTQDLEDMKPNNQDIHDPDDYHGPIPDKKSKTATKAQIAEIRSLQEHKAIPLKAQSDINAWIKDGIDKNQAERAIDKLKSIIRENDDPDIRRDDLTNELINEACEQWSVNKINAIVGLNKVVKNEYKAANIDSLSIIWLEELLTGIKSGKIKRPEEK